MLMRTPTRWVRPKRQLPPGFIVPCQPIIARTVPAGDGWLHELKHDGFRILAFKDGERVRLWSRNGRDWSGEFVAITAAVRALPFRRVMFDGEAVAHCLEGLPHFTSCSAATGREPVARPSRMRVLRRARAGARGRTAPTTIPCSDAALVEVLKLGRWRAMNREGMGAATAAQRLPTPRRRS
jgi:hypothetical protein